LSVEAVPLNVPIYDVFEWFCQHRDWPFLPVVDPDGIPVGVLREHDFKVFAYSPFGKSMSSRTTSLSDPDPAPGSVTGQHSRIVQVLLVTDQTMPGMTGAELVRQVLSIRPEMPIIMCTGYSETFSQEMARKMGIRDYILKPTDFRQLAARIKSLAPFDCHDRP
jgi:CheY-like chemotaxis protein